jgi:hypothetical protein
MPAIVTGCTRPLRGGPSGVFVPGITGFHPACWRHRLPAWVWCQTGGLGQASVGSGYYTVTGHGALQADRPRLPGGARIP